MGEEPKCHQLRGVLLDSYSLHPGHRVSVCQTVANHTPYSMCVALSSPDDYTTTIAITKYSSEDLRTELQAEVGTLKDIPSQNKATESLLWNLSLLYMTTVRFVVCVHISVMCATCIPLS